MAEMLFDVLNKEHFIYGKNLNDTKFLISCSRKIGLDAERVRRYLSDYSEDRQHVIALMNTLKSNGLDHIPVFIINNTIVVDGAPNTATFIRIFRDLEAQIVAEQRNPRVRPREEEEEAEDSSPKKLCLPCTAYRGEGESSESSEDNYPDTDVDDLEDGRKEITAQSISTVAHL